MEEHDLDKNILLISFVFYFVVFVPFTVYCYSQLWIYRGEIFMKKRHVALLLCTINCMFLLTTRAVMFNPHACAVSTICGHISIETEVLVELFALYPLIVAFTARVWFLFYDLEWNAIVLNLEWWHHINENQTNNNWILKYRNTLGSLTKFMWKYLLLYCVVCIVGSMILIFYNQFEVVNILSSVQMIMSLIITDLVLCKFVSVSDIFKIRNELNIVMLIWTIACLYFAISESVDAQHKHVLFAYAKSWINMLICFSISYMTILYPINHLKSDKQSEINASHKNVNVKTDFDDYVFSCSQNFNSFMQHLVKEMAVENLCFLLEVFQLKQQYTEDTSFTANIGLQMNIPSDLPLSSLIDGSKDLKQQMMLLYNKYIIDSAELQLNISWENRGAIEGRISELKQVQETDCNLNILLIYDGTLIEVKRLLYGSFMRFKAITSL